MKARKEDGVSVDSEKQQVGELRAGGGFNLQFCSEMRMALKLEFQTRFLQICPGSESFRTAFHCKRRFVDHSVPFLEPSFGAVVAYILPKSKLQPSEILFLALTAACVFSILDLLAPDISGGAMVYRYW